MDHSYAQTNERLKFNDDESLPETFDNPQDNECEKPIDMSLHASNKLDPNNCIPTPETLQEPSKHTNGVSIFEQVMVKEECLTPERSPSPEPIDLSLRDRSSDYLDKFKKTIVEQEDELSLRNRFSSTFQEILQQTIRDRNDATSPQPIDMSSRERCGDFRKMLDEIKQENEEEDMDDMFCVDGITDSKESEEKINFERWKTENLYSMQSEFGDQENNVEDSKSFKCTTCSKRFLTKSRLTKHLLTHSEQCFRCSFCDFNTKRKDYLRVHEMNHLETKMFKCLKCNFGTNVRSRLKVHESIHSEEKSFQCFKCKYKTTRKDNLKLHELNHLDIKRFRCEHCEYGSNNKRNLKEHMLNHLDLRLFKCPECPYETNKKGNLKLHQGKHVRAALVLKLE